MKRSGMMAVGVAALALAGIATAQTGTITFRGAIVNPSCGFTPPAEHAQARCFDAAGRPVSAPMPPARAQGHAHVATAQMRVEPVFRSSPGRRNGKPDGFVMVVTYQ